MTKKFLLLFIALILSNQYLSAQSNPDRHSTNIEESWLSCATNDHPKQGFPNAHWIQYDLGYVYALEKSQIWNINHPDHLASGTKTYAVDVSMDGVEWQFVGEYELAQGNASGYYLGEDGPDFEGIEARYVLITVNSNYGGDCMGFAEFKVDASEAASTHTYNLDKLDFNIEPNPVGDFVNLHFEKVNEPSRYDIYDISGKKILSGSISDNLTAINTGGLTSGIFTIRISNTTGFATKKMIKH